jgi:flagellar biosynthesis/type III secretory pathway protein FliH
MTLLQKAEKWTQEWKAEGLAKGRAEGKEEGSRLVAAKILKNQLQRRFGDLPSQTTDRIDRADVDTLERWTYRVLDAASIEEVLRAEEGSEKP